MTKPALSWLHISDLHVGIRDSGTDWHRSIQLFLDDIERVLDRTGPVDLVLFTGDLTQSGKETEFKQLDEQVLGPLWQRLANGGSEPLLLAVPGNHDLQWSNSTLFARAICKDPTELWKEVPGTFTFVCERFAAYASWWQASPYRPKENYHNGFLPGDFVYVHEKDGARFGVAGLNTAVLHLHDEVRPGELRVHKHQLRRALDGGDVSQWLARNHLNLLLTHHPPDWLNTLSRDEDFDGGLQAGAFDLHLFGHMHEPFAEAKLHGSGARQQILQAASLFGIEHYTTVEDDGMRTRRSERRYGYMVAQLQRKGESCQLRAWPRRGFRAREEHWRMGPDGSFALEDDVLAAPLFDLPPQLRLPDEHAPLALAPVLANEQPWDESVRAHRLWGEGPEHEEWRERATALVHTCREAWDRIAASIDHDPWRDPGYPVRVLDRLAALEIGALAAPQVFLLLVAPFAHEVVWAQGLAWLHGKATPEDFDEHPDAQEPRLTLQRTHRAYPRVIRLARRLGPSHRRTLAMWLAHRALDHLPEIWEPDEAPRMINYELLRRQAGGAFEPLSALVRCAAGNIAQLDVLREKSDRVVAGMPVQQARLATLLVAASAAALDVRAVDELAVYHVGGPEGFAVEHLAEAANHGRWEQREDGCVFTHACREPVQHYCVVDLVRRADTIGKELRALPDQLGSGLPTEIAATGVVPEHDHTGNESFRPIHVRFRLDHNRIRDLLMGESLYGDPGLAIRELYQNALDACRYRRARNEYLRKQRPSYTDEYTGRIVFRQGKDGNGRVFIECQDDGVGMSERMLERVFAVAGQRFHDQPTYFVEKGRWEHHGIKLYPNSQHGIGVLSYFMLADELEIETREQREDGRRGGPLYVRISSASGLFHVREAATDLDCGTRVRLYLNRTRYTVRDEFDDEGEDERKISVAEILCEQLIVAEFDTEIHEGVEEGTDTPKPGTLVHHWQPGVPLRDPLIFRYSPKKWIPEGR